MQKKLRHSKFRNTGILFELLAKQVTSEIISGKDNSIAKDILYKYFKANTELSKEWQLYNSLISEKIKDEHQAERLLNIVLEARRKINNKKLLQEKYFLISEIKNAYPLDDLLRSPIKNYKLLASIYKLFEDSAESSIKFNIKESLQAKTYIIETITEKSGQVQPEDELIKYYNQQSEDIRLLSYKLLIEKLNDKYSSKLDDNQKEILREYIYNVSNTNQFSKFIHSKINEIKENISKINDKIKSTDVIYIKVKEVLHQLNEICNSKIVKDNHVVVLLLAQDLYKELKKNI